MELNQEQINFIAGIIHDHLSFSDDSKTFHQQLASLQKSLLPNSTEVSLEYKFLRKCLLDSKHHLLRLENLGNQPIKISDVIFEILNLISVRIGKQATKLNVDLKNTAWDSELIYESCISLKDFNELFKTNASNIVIGTGITELLPLSNKIYTRELSYVENTYENEKNEIIDRKWQPIVRVRIPCVDPPIYKKLLFKEFDNVFETDDDQDDFYKNLKKEIDEYLLKYVGDCVLNHWEKKFNLNIIASMFYDLITHETYFSMVENGQINVADLLVTPEDLKTLLAPGVSNLFKYKLCNIPFALQLSPAALQIIAHPTYNQLLKEKKISINKVDKLSEARAKFLIFPTIANLIKQKKLLMRKACKLPFAIKPIFGMQRYIQYFNEKGKDFNWGILYFFTNKNCEYLKNPRIAELIVTGKLDFIDVKAMDKAEFKNVSDETIFELLKNDILTKREALGVQPFIPDYFVRYPYLPHWIKSNATNLFDVQIYSLTCITTDVFSKRIFRIFDNNPLKINGEMDTFTKIFAEINKIAIDCNETPSELWSHIIQKFLPMFKESVYREKLQNLEYRNNYDEVLNFLSDNNVSPEESINAFKDVYEWANCSLHQISKASFSDDHDNKSIFTKAYNIFFPTNKKQKTHELSKPQQQLQFFCNKVKGLEPIYSFCDNINRENFAMRM